MLTETKYPNIEVQLSGEDGNVFAIIGRIRAAMRRAGVREPEIVAFTNEISATRSYDEALQCAMRWVDCQ